MCCKNLALMLFCRSLNEKFFFCFCKLKMRITTEVLQCHLNFAAHGHAPHCPYQLSTSSSPVIEDFVSFMVTIDKYRLDIYLVLSSPFPSMISFLYPSSLPLNLTSPDKTDKVKLNTFLKHSLSPTVTFFSGQC